MQCDSADDADVRHRMAIAQTTFGSLSSNRCAAPPGSGEKCTRTGEGVYPATTLMRRPDGKSERGDDG